MYSETDYMYRYPGVRVFGVPLFVIEISESYKKGLTDTIYKHLYVFQFSNRVTSIHRI